MATVKATVPIETVKVGNGSAKDMKTLEKALGRSLGSPINGYKVDESFKVTLTGEIAITEYDGRKSAHFLTKQGIKVAVNASFNPSLHKEGHVMECVCREIPVERNGEKVMIKFAAQVAG